MSARRGWIAKILPGNKTAFTGSSAVLALTIPIVAILGACFYLCYWILRSSAHQADAAELEAEQRIAKAAILFTTAPIVKVEADYANWDQMFRYARKPDNFKWADSILGQYQEDFSGATGTAVLTEDGQLRYLHLSPRAGAPAWAPQELRFFTTLTRNVLAGKGMQVRTGFIAFRGKPVFLAIVPITASGLEGESKNQRPFATLIFLQNFDSKLLSAFSNFNLVHARVVPAAQASLKLANFPGARADFGLAWKTRPVSQSIIGGAFPALKVLAVLSLLLVGAVAGSWSWILIRVRKMEAASLTERTLIAEQTAEAKSLFVANMSHELRTPLNAIIGFSEMLANQVFGPLGHRKYGEYAEDVLASGRHLLGVVNNILLMSKLDAKKHEYEIAAVAVDLVVREAMTLVSADAAKRGISVAFKNDGENPTAFADRQALKQVVINLLSNAVKFSFGGSQVDIAIKEYPAAETIELRVTDHGCGMSEELLQKLGQPFTQASHAYIRNNQGTGLGLSICFALVAGFGGVLELQSAEEAGTTAILRLRSAPSQALALNPGEARAA